MIGNNGSSIIRHYISDGKDTENRIMIEVLKM